MSVGLCVQGDVFISGVWTKRGEKKKIEFLWAIEVFMVKLTPGSWAVVDVLTAASSGWRWATIRRRTRTMTSLSATKHSPSVSAQLLSQLPAVHTSIIRTRTTNYSSERSVFCEGGLIGRVEGRIDREAEC